MEERGFVGFDAGVEEETEGESALGIDWERFVESAVEVDDSADADIETVVEIDDCAGGIVDVRKAGVGKVDVGKVGVEVDEEVDVEINVGKVDAEEVDDAEAARRSNSYQ